MEEKVLVTQSSKERAKGFKKYLTICLLVFAFFVLLQIIAAIQGNIEGNIVGIGAYLPYIGSCLLYLLILIICYAYYKGLSNVELTITDKRVYGVTFWGKRVDLPLDSISAVGIGSFKAITFSTSSGRISFSGVANIEKMHKTISDLLLERQSKPKETTTIKQEVPLSNADELKKYKDLLDSGVITQEEFDAKKKQLLGL